MRLAVETLEELDWCLDQLESLQVGEISRKEIGKKRGKIASSFLVGFSMMMHKKR